jgi:hypothetical protein
MVGDGICRGYQEKKSPEACCQMTFLHDRLLVLHCKSLCMRTIPYNAALVHACSSLRFVLSLQKCCAYNPPAENLGKLWSGGKSHG